MALGPLRLADSIGLDTCLSIMKVLHRQFGDSKYRPCPLLAQYVDGGWLGVKTGEGRDTEKLPRFAYIGSSLREVLGLRVPRTFGCL